MALFFIDTESGTVATERQLIAAGVITAGDTPERPWHLVRGDRDANTLWHTILRKQTHGIWIGTVAFRHSDHHSSLLQAGWQEVTHDEISDFGPAAPSDGQAFDPDGSASGQDDVDPEHIARLFGPG